MVSVPAKAGLALCNGKLSAGTDVSLCSRRALARQLLAALRGDSSLYNFILQDY